MRINEVLNSIPNEKAKWGGVFPDDGMDQFDFKTNNGIGYELHFLAPGFAPDEIDLSDFDFFNDISDEAYDNSRFIEFNQVPTNRYQRGAQGIEGTGSAAEVFGIVVNSIIQYIKKHNTPLIYFQAAEPNRRSLYIKIIQRLLASMPGWKYKKSDDGGKFALYNPKAIV